MSEWISDVCAADLEQRAEHVAEAGAQHAEQGLVHGAVEGHRLHMAIERGGDGLGRGAAALEIDRQFQRPADPVGHPGLSQQLAEVDVLAVQTQRRGGLRSEEHTSELQSLMRISYAVFCLKKKKT